MTDGKCYPKMDVGDACENHEECNNGIQGAAWCQQNDETGVKTCGCKIQNYWHAGRDMCLPSILPKDADGNYECVDKKQCEYTLGKYSSCDSANRCNCQGGNIYKGACYLQKQLNDTCDISLECIASLGTDSFCDESIKRCLCEPGKVCAVSGKSLMGMSQASLSTLGIALIVGFVLVAGGIAGCLFCKRKKEYSPVHQASVTKK